MGCLWRCLEVPMAIVEQWVHHGVSSRANVSVDLYIIYDDRRAI
jgi:hypothetical protein